VVGEVEAGLDGRPPLDGGVVLAGDDLVRRYPQPPGQRPGEARLAGTRRTVEQHVGSVLRSAGQQLQEVLDGGGIHLVPLQRQGRRRQPDEQVGSRDLHGRFLEQAEEIFTQPEIAALQLVHAQPLQGAVQQNAQFGRGQAAQHGLQVFSV